MIDIDKLTIGEARQLAAVLAPLLDAAPAAPLLDATERAVAGADPLLARFVGRICVVRDHRSGVWLGEIVAVGATSLVLDAGARRAWSWTGAGSCSGLAVTGPSGGQITAPSLGEVYLCDLVEVVVASPAAIAAWAGVPSWTGR